MTDETKTEPDRELDQRVLKAAVRLSLLALLVLWCLRILSPFVDPIVGGIVIAIALNTPYRRLTDLLGGRQKLSATILVIAGLLLLIVPTLALGASLVESSASFSEELAHDQIKIPPPPDAVAQWPVIGKHLYAIWLSTSQNLESALVKLAPYLKDVGIWLVSMVGDLGLGLFMFVVAILIAGFLLPNQRQASLLATKFAFMVAGPRGPKLVALAADSVRSVTRGVLGVAIIQSLLAGLGMLAVGVPAAGLWTLLILILAVMQLPPTLVLIPVVVYVFYTSSTTVAVLFAVWAAVVGFSDNILKPLLMGRGSSVPMLVLFMGSLGGFMSGGILGLFVGAVVLSLGYTIFMAWVDEAEGDEALGTSATEAQ